MGWPMAVAVAVLAAVCVAAGALLVRDRTTALSGSLLVLAGALGLGAAGAEWADSGTTQDVLAVLATLLFFPLAAMTYPRPNLGHPVDFVAAVTIGAAGLVGATTATNPGAVAA